MGHRLPFSNAALVMTIHDTDGRLRPGLAAVGERLAAYDGVYAVATEGTDAGLIEEVMRRGVEVAIGPGGEPGTGQRQALAMGLGAGHDDLFVCDFDRWLHWAATFPDELDDLPRRMGEEFGEAWYVCLGRTPRAHATHPQTQVLPETATNRALSAVLGRTVDATAGASWIRREAAEVIVAQAVETSKATDLEWPGLVLQADPVAGGWGVRGGAGVRDAGCVPGGDRGDGVAGGVDRGDVRPAAGDAGAAAAGGGCDWGVDAGDGTGRPLRRSSDRPIAMRRTTQGPLDMTEEGWGARRPAIRVDRRPSTV